jgi:hypothetical protein
MRERLKVQCDLPETSRVHVIDIRFSLTVDCWACGSMELYIGITGHYVSVCDQAWSLKKDLLRFKVLDGPHSSVNLVTCVVNVAKDLSILKKVHPSFQQFTLFMSIVGVDKY